MRIETRGNTRTRKARERQALRRKEILIRETQNKKQLSYVRKRRQDPNHVKEENDLRSIRRQRQKISSRLARNHKVKDTGIPLRVLEMNSDFVKLTHLHSAWPQQIKKEIANETLALFRAKISMDNLRELPCAICSSLQPKKSWKRISVDRINLSLLKAPDNLTSPTFEIDFTYGHPLIDNYGQKLLFDREGFISTQDIGYASDDPFDLRVCNSCHRHLRNDNTPPLSLASNMWIGPTPPCLEGLTIPEQLLISPGYLCMNLIQLTNKKHTHHKLKGHIVTLPQNPMSLAKILPLPMFRLCEYLKVVFVGPGVPTERQLKRVLQVRKSKVAAALQWLFQHNALFKDNIELDESALNDLPECDIPRALRVTTTVVDLDSRNVEHYTGYSQDPLDKQDNDYDSSEDDDDDQEIINNNTIRGSVELRPSGIVHTDNVPVSEREMTLLSLQKLLDKSVMQTQAQMHDYNTDTIPSHPNIIRMPHARSPMNEYKDTHLFPAAFPVLYPYGVGGHINHSSNVPLKEYLNHLMRHRDPKFRQHRSFPFVAFDILQRRLVSSESYNLTRAAGFERSARLIANLTPDDMKVAIEQEQRKQPVTNPAVLELLRNVNSAGSKLMASHQSRARMRNEIRAITVQDGTPSLFITINPADLHSPIVMMYAGQEIDFDNLSPDNFPTATERARLAHLDASAVAKYFDVVIQGIIKTIVGYGREDGGVFGSVKNYYGVVEYQDRGTPHCHMLIWLHGALDPIALRQKLKSDEEFCHRLLKYVSDIVREDVSYLLQDGDELTDDMLNAEYLTPKTLLEKRMHPSFMPIPDPKHPDFEETLRQDLLAIAKRTLIHYCNRTCRKYNRGLQRNCRFDFPREFVDPPGIVFPDQGIIAVQRVNAFVNNHNPYLTAACRGNNDIKFISARKLALAYIHYITDYITKSDVSTHSSFLMCAATLQTFLDQSSDTASLDLVDKSRKLVAKCLNKIVGQSELTSPQVSAHLLGIPDHYTPCKFVSIHLQTFESYLTREKSKLHQIPSDEVQRYYNDEQNNNDAESDTASDQTDDDQHQLPESFIISSSRGKLTAINLRIDYQYRGPSLRGICLYDYAATIQKVLINPHELSMLSRQYSGEGKHYVDRFPFRGDEVEDKDSAHPQYQSHLQMHRKRGTERIVILCGKGIPKKNDIENAERYALCILLLFKPWETVYDLLECYSSWIEAYQAFQPSLSPRIQSIIDNIDLLHRCSEETALDRELRQNARNNPSLAKARRIERSVAGYDAEEEQALFDDCDNYHDMENTDPQHRPTFDPALIVRSGLRDLNMVDETTSHLRIRGRFPDDSTKISSNPTTTIINHGWMDVDISNVRASDDHDEELLKDWKNTIVSRKAAQQTNDNIDVQNSVSLSAYLEPQAIDNEQTTTFNADTIVEDIDPLNDLAIDLNEEQKKAYFLVCNHRQRNQVTNEYRPSQLLLYLSGAGGTGKTKVIQSIVNYFERTSQRNTLVVLAPTGVAAASICGRTIHSACGFGFGEDDKKTNFPTGDLLRRQQEIWAKIEYVIIDEISMIGQKLLARFHAFLKIAKATDDSSPFAGLNILFVGDFMQLPPVLDPPLYTPSKVANFAVLSSPESRSGIKRKRQQKHVSISSNTVTNTTGRDLWLNVKHVILLKKPMRQIDDPFYAGILDAFRKGRLTEDQKNALRSRILGDDRVKNPEWKDASILVTRNEARVQLNFDATVEHAQDLGQPLIYSCAEDSYRQTILTGYHRQNFLSTPDTKDNALCGILPLSISMKVVLTVNICTADGLANGAQGILRQIVYDKADVDELYSQPGSIVLQKPPKYVVVELTGPSPGAYKDLPQNHVPIYPVKRTCVHTFWTRDGNKIQRRFQRMQLPLTPAYAFTDFKCQGQTLSKAIIDLAGNNSNNSTYVMLSRVKKLEDLLILRPFKDSILDYHHTPALRTEIDRLQKCAEKTDQLEEWPNSCIVVSRE